MRSISRIQFMLNDQRIAILSAERMETGGRFWGLPYPGRLVRIDYIFHSDGWRAEAAWVGEWDGFSDHRPVVARLRLPHAD